MNLENLLNASYVLMILLGMALFAFFRPTSHYSTPEKRSYWRLQAITLLAAVLGAKFAVLMGDGLWPLRPVEDWSALLWSGRSIVGALLFGFLAAEAFKPVLNYRMPPNDRFAIVLPFSIATGRLGCWFTGCCLGVPMHDGIALVAADGVPRYPAALVEAAFHLIAGLCLMAMWRRGLMAGRLFAVYLLGYGAFRFVNEYLRVTEKAFAGLSAYQWFCLAMMLAAVVALYLRRGGSPTSPQPLAGAAG